ncbi:uncharacterized protein TRIREDRAFT_106049 [Trichoderma reesei QM6a]|uniref:Predicted protein n=2 Tax=Hypocrea jecorina TaxID=51453 RepID=G0RG74_HYPJQ|nr:uncharacterized protein TRIREDRAFT_106049 [Trichoderma reesei QM6a]EGR49996.1 predicted protein [Trichoderma reesei QM6a]ETS03430.1 hypothetical protein M419DRAFT_34297 [Trichoderma reesei RUT C-30]
MVIKPDFETFTGSAKMHQPVVRFPSQEEYVRRLEQGTLIEMENELSQLKKLNARGDTYPAWIIAPIPGCQTSFATSWLLMAKNPHSTENVLFPTVADRFTIDIKESVELPHGVFTLYHLPATRIENPFDNVGELKGSCVQKLAAFKVEVPRCQRTDDGEQTELDIMAHLQVSGALDNISEWILDENNRKNISIRWEVTSQTFEAELDALRFFVAPKRSEKKGPSHRSKLAFDMLQHFQPEDPEITNLLAKYRHLAEPHNPVHKISPVLVQKFADFNCDHLAAHEGLGHIKNGLFLVNGCPGAGKTEWNMVISALIQSHFTYGAKKRLLRRLVTGLYRDVLAGADFVATTPVAASGSFYHFFHPEIVFVDEAPHARELTTLIPLAYFDPVAWIFTGDVKQTRPFVNDCGSAKNAEIKGLKFNPYTEQLRLSTMARAVAADALDHKLLVNNRAYGNLHRLPSAIFYDGEMISGHDEQSMYPPSTAYLKGHLEKLLGRGDLQENRVVVSFASSAEQTHRSSFWNPKQHNWVVEQAKCLLGDSEFQSVSGTPGTIMIQTPYSTAYREYQAEVKRWPEEWQGRVQVLTVDKAQGNQADVVFLDMVRTTSVGFMDDPQRLNVAITRARQAEIIVMHVRMNYRQARGCRRTRYATQLWADAQVHRRLVHLH